MKEAIQKGLDKLVEMKYISVNEIVNPEMLYTIIYSKMLDMSYRDVQSFLSDLKR